MATLVSSTAWVQRGRAAQFPLKYELNETEYARINSLGALELQDAKEGYDEAQQEEHDGTATGATADELKEYDLENYSDSDGDAAEATGMFGNPSDLAFHQSNEDDPYISLAKIVEDEERQELEILPSDNLLVVAKTEDDVSYLEVHVYEDAHDNLYVHHDVMLPSYPICVECMDFRAATGDLTTPGNFAAIGMMEPDIEIWDLDTVDSIYPNAVLGRSKERGKKKKAKKNEKYHVDAVLCLAWSQQHRSLLASGSADDTIKLWDLASLKCAQSYSYHHDKVSTLAWSSLEPTVLLSGGYDQRAVMADMRAPEGETTHWGLTSDIESVKWDPHRTDHFYATSDDGMIRLFDSRGGSESKPLWQLLAHDGPVAAFAVNPNIPGFLASSSSDSVVKIWNVQAAGPSMVASQDLGTGKHFSLNFAPDAEVAFRLAVAGSAGVAQIWDTSINPMIRKTFAAKMSTDSTNTTDGAM